jgi:hypothetical protein
MFFNLRANVWNTTCQMPNAQPSLRELRRNINSLPSDLKVEAEVGLKAFGLKPLRKPA